MKSPGELFDKIEAVFMAGGMPLSELAYDGRNAFSSKELKETFNLDKFQRGRKTYSVFRRGKLYCKRKGEDGKYCGWQIAWSYRKSEGGFLIINNQESKSNTSYTSNMRSFTTSMRLTIQSSTELPRSRARETSRPRRRAYSSTPL